MLKINKCYYYYYYSLNFTFSFSIWNVWLICQNFKTGKEFKWKGGFQLCSQSNKFSLFTFLLMHWFFNANWLKHHKLSLEIEPPKQYKLHLKPMGKIQKGQFLKSPIIWNLIFKSFFTGVPQLSNTPCKKR